MNFNRELLAKLIRIKIADEGKSYREVSSVLGLSMATISRTSKKNGRSVPDVISLYKICNWLEISPNEFLIKTNLSDGESNI